MIKTSYENDLNAVIIEFIGIVEASEGEKYFAELPGAIPKHGKGFNLLVDLSSLQRMDPQIRPAIKKAMDLFNAQGVTKVIRVIPHFDKDIGLNIMSLFHYSSKVKTVTLQSRKEAEERLMNATSP